jgi:serine/threonine protein kinase
MIEETLFHEALAKPAATRAAFLGRACAGQPDLRAAVEALLAAHEADADLLDRPAGQVGQTAGADFGAARPLATGEYAPGPGERRFRRANATDSGPAFAPGAVIAGRYKLLEQIGEGGMGKVWVAEQRDPVKRLVGLKLIKPGMDSASVLARFEAERQALALMDHPNIAKVLDGGTSADGHPFFVMELVKGLPLTEYCDNRRLNVPERLDLFIQICAAVQHAHQKGIIHRDLKPSNVLVTEHDGTPVPKVIDFGLAKALFATSALTDRTLHTAYGTVVGTPLYMAPEQVGINALDVDTRTDIYALGVILYELLTGTTPVEKKRFNEAAWEEMKRVIREEEPPRPSKRLSSSGSLPGLAASRHTEPAGLTRLVRGELDWIVMKALEKDRNRRYDTANGFAMDVRRYLAGEPVLAVPPSAGYRMQKFLRRNKGRVAAAAALVFALVAGSAAVMVVQARANRELAAMNERLNQANERERKRFALALEAVDLFHGEVSKDLLLKEKQFEGLRNKLLKGAAGFYEKLEELLKDRADAESRATLGKAYHELGELTWMIGDKQAALAVLCKGLEVRRELAGRPDSRPEAALDVARTLLALTKVQEEVVGGESSLESAREMAAVTEQAEARFGASEASQAVLASAYRALGRYLDSPNRGFAEATAALERARGILQSLVDAHPLNRAYQRDLAYTQDQLAAGSIAQGKLDEGIAEHRKTRALWLLATADPSDLEGRAALAKMNGNIGAILRRAGLLAEALESLEAASAIYHRLLETNPSVSAFQEESSFFGGELGEVLRRVGRPAEARVALERSRDMHERLVEAHPKDIAYRDVLASIHTSLGDVARATARPDEARAEYGRALVLGEEVMKATPKEPIYAVGVADNLRRLGLLEYAAGRFADAAAANRRALALYLGVPKLWERQVFELACCQAALAGLAGKDGSGVPAADGLAEADKAMELLRKAVAGGYLNLYELRNDAGLDALRQRNDFQKLVADLQNRMKNQSAATNSRDERGENRSAPG